MESFEKKIPCHFLLFNVFVGKMKKLFFAVGAFFALILCSCNNELNENHHPSDDLYYGSVVISEKEAGSNRALDIKTLVFASASVTGDGIKEQDKPFVKDIVIKDGKGALVIDKVPVGKNRIVTVQALDSSKTEIFGVKMRAICDIESGKTTNVSVNWQTTALGNVFNKLNEMGETLSSISVSDINTISSLIDSSLNPLLIDTDSIAIDFKNKALKSNSYSYALAPATLDVTVNETDSFKIQVCDPSSSVTNGSGTSVTVSNIAPGTWKVYLLDSADRKINEKTVVFTSGKTSTVSFEQITDKIVAHVEESVGWTHVYAWVNVSEEIFGKWPGRAMTDTDSDGWYDVEIEKTSCNLIFNGSAPQTKDLSLDAGEWWYKDGKWYSEDPTDNENPSISSFTAEKSSADGSSAYNLSVEAYDNKTLKKAEFFIGEEKIGEVLFSSLSSKVVFEWDSSTKKNGTYEISAVVYDAAGNKSSSKTATVTLQNPNSIPVAVITGSKNVGKGVEKVYSAASSSDKNGTVEGYTWTVTGATIVSGNGTKEITVKTPDSEGTFTVSLVVTDDEGADSDSVSIEVTVKDKVSTDFREESIYFLMTARFYDGDPSNNRWCRSDASSGNRANNDYPWRGDFKGLIEKLDYIKALGFSAIWITPPVLNRSDFDFHGYHAWNMNKIDPRLESAGATYQDLINECHKRGMKVIQDIVLNHSSRYGLEDLFVPKYWGDRDDPDWGKDSDINYYDEYNPSFTYNGLDIEPKSGKTWYNGDLWQKEKPSLPWNPDLSTWGVKLGNNTEGRPYYGCQWPNLSLFNPEYFHTKWLGNWEDETCQSGTIHEDCIDLNTESAAVQKYLIDAYTKYIEMGVDGFRVDTVKHVSRLMFNRHFIPAFKEAGGENFYMFGEVCTRVNEVWNHGVAPLSTPFYTWKERTTYSADDSVAVHEAYEYEKGVNNQPTSDNHALIGNEYHKPDYSKKSGLDVIDFPMHWNFDNAGQAYRKREDDKYYNDATWNVVYVDSHDYGPNMDNRYAGGTDAWAENMTYMWTFRGIPCLYYGSEIEFKAGEPCDKGPSAPLESTGRAYYGENIEGSVKVSGFGEWSDATGNMKTTLESPLSKHLSHLNKIRRQIPALQKGQYSNEGCSGSMAFKRRFTDDSTDSFVLVTISGGATFTGLPAGTYTDVVTGDVQTISEGGTVTADCSGKGNARIYVLTTAKTAAPGKITGNSPYLKLSK